VNVIFNSIPVEFTETSVILEVNGDRKEIANDYVWIFVGGTPPNDFLKKVGVEFGMSDVTVQASGEAKEAARSKLAGAAAATA
jgi:thioredoxin reductase